MSSFIKKLETLWEKDKFLCIGLDPVLEKLPSSLKENFNTLEEQYFQFNKAIIDSTHDIVCAYKPQVAHYEEQGAQGFKALEKTVLYLNKYHPKVPVIIDAKRGDIVSTNEVYAKAYLDNMGFDAITVNPYFGKEALQPFLDKKEKGVIVLVRTSNPGAGELQDLEINGEPLYLIIARKVSSEWNENGNCLLVVGSTYPEELAKVRSVAPDISFLIPGIGAQGGDIGKTVKAGRDSRNQGMIFHSSRAIIFASKNSDFAQAARQKALEIDNQIDQARKNA